MKKLIDLNAVFYRVVSPGRYHEADPKEAQGILFDCPRDECKHMVLVWFADRGVPAEETPLPRWKVTGTSLTNLTLNPSINIPGVGCGWHGWIRNGSVEGA